MAPLTSLHRFSYAFLALLLLQSATPLASEQPLPSLKQQLIQAHGFHRFEEIKTLSFDFHARIAVAIRVDRSWEWNVETNVVTLKDSEGDIELQYDRDLLSTLGQKEKETDSKFINDTFWLAWPLHLSWNNDVRVEDMGMKNDPLIKSPRRCIVIDYSTTTGGYTPGDRYELFFAEDGDLLPETWAYYPAGKNEPKVVCSWENYTTVEGFTFAQKHENSNGLFKLWKDEISVTTR
jgi:hypothetical protein